MHDTAVRSANFTECVPVLAGKGMRVAADGRRVGKEPTHHVAAVCAGRGGLRWDETLRALTRIATIGCRTAMGYDSFQ
jgi:hypothetical protein